VIELIELRRNYAPVTALAGLSLTVPKGCPVRAAGPQRCGQDHRPAHRLQPLLAPDSGSVKGGRARCPGPAQGRA